MELIETGCLKKMVSNPVRCVTPLTPEFLFSKVQVRVEHGVFKKFSQQKQKVDVELPALEMTGPVAF